MLEVGMTFCHIHFFFILKWVNRFANPKLFLIFANEINKQLKIMRIKHFAGYGSVEVKKISKKSIINEYGENKTILVLRVKGNHEWGLVRNDILDAKRWLFDKFEKNFTKKECYIDMDIKSDYVNENGHDVEVATYTFVY